MKNLNPIRFLKRSFAARFAALAIMASGLSPYQAMAGGSASADRSPTASGPARTLNVVATMNLKIGRPGGREVAGAGFVINSAGVETGVSISPAASQTPSQGPKALAPSAVQAFQSGAKISATGASKLEAASGASNAEAGPQTASNQDMETGSSGSPSRSDSKGESGKAGDVISRLSGDQTIMAAAAGDEQASRALFHGEKETAGGAIEAAGKFSKEEEAGLVPFSKGGVAEQGRIKAGTASTGPAKLLTRFGAATLFAAVLASSNQAFAVLPFGGPDAPPEATAAGFIAVLGIPVTLALLWAIHGAGIEIASVVGELKSKLAKWAIGLASISAAIGSAYAAKLSVAALESMFNARIMWAPLAMWGAIFMAYAALQLAILPVAMAVKAVRSSGISARQALTAFLNRLEGDLPIIAMVLGAIIGVILKTPYYDLASYAGGTVWMAAMCIFTYNPIVKGPNRPVRVFDHINWLMVSLGLLFLAIGCGSRWFAPYP